MKFHNYNNKLHNLIMLFEYSALWIRTWTSENPCYEFLSSRVPLCEGGVVSFIKKEVGSLYFL